MKSLVNFINEIRPTDLNSSKIFKKLAKNMSEEDKTFVTTLYKEENHNTYRTMEEVEKILWKEDNETIDKYFAQIKNILKIVNFTPSQIVDTYSLARSGKQMKIEVIAQVGYFANEAIY